MGEAFDLHRAGDSPRALIRYLYLSALGLHVAQANAAFLLAAGVRTGAEMWPSDGGEADQLMVRLYRQSAAQGNVGAYLHLGDYHYMRHAQYAEALVYFQAAAERSHPAALWNLGYMHQRGLGLAQDLDLAKRYYNRAWQSSPDASLPVVASLAGLYIERVTRTLAQHLAGVPLGAPLVIVALVFWRAVRAALR